MLFLETEMIICEITDLSIKTMHGDFLQFMT